MCTVKRGHVRYLLNATVNQSGTALVDEVLGVVHVEASDKKILQGSSRT